MFFKKKKDLIKLDISLNTEKIIEDIEEKLDKAIDEIIDNLNIDDYISFEENDKK